MPKIINLKADTGLVDRSDNTIRFYNDIKKYDVLTSDQEKKLFTMYKNGSEEEKEYARNALIACNQRLVVAVAKKYADTDTLLDYVNEINFGLIEAIDDFDINRGVRFNSFCIYYMKRAVNEYNNKIAPLVRKTNQSKTFSVLSKATSNFVQDNERNPSTEELLDIINKEYGVKIKDCSDLIDTRVSRIDDMTNAQSDTDFSDFKDLYEYNRASQSINDYENVEDSEYNKQLLSSLLNVLSPREKQVIEMRFGIYELNGYKREYELAEIAEELGLTKERVRQMESSILKRLHKEYAKRLNKLM